MPVIDMKNCALSNWYTLILRNLAIFTNFSSKSKRCFVPGVNFRRIIVDLLAQILKVGGGISKNCSAAPSNPARLPTKTKRVSYDFQGFVGCLQLPFETYMIAMLHGSFLLGIHIQCFFRFLAGLK